MRLSNTMMVNASLLPSSKRAFTLAEVLITLSILGVVAALTIPSLVNRQSDLAAQVKLKKAVSAYEDAAGTFMVEKQRANISTLLKANYAADGDLTCDNLSSYFKIVGTPTENASGCSFTTSDGAAWYIDENGNATVADTNKANSARYAVSMWVQNGQVNGTGLTDGSPNAPTTLLTDLYNDGTNATSLTDPTKRFIAPVTEFMHGTYYCGSNSITVATSGDTAYKPVCASGSGF